MKQLIDLLHILQCRKNHESDMARAFERLENVCYYYLENDIADGEGMEDHTIWTQNVEKFKIAMNLGSDQETMDFIRDCIKISHQIHSLSSGSKYRVDFIKSLLNL